MVQKQVSCWCFAEAIRNFAEEISVAKANVGNAEG